MVQIVTNAGFFNTTSFDCFGNLVSRGEVSHSRTITYTATALLVPAVVRVAREC